MGRMNGNARVHDDTKIVTDEKMARDLCRGTAYGWQNTRNFVLRRDRGNPCARCGGPIDFSLPSTHHLGWTIDHMGIRVEDCVGLTKGNARRRLHDVNQLSISHKRCNSADNRNKGNAVLTPPTVDLSKPAIDKTGWAWDPDRRWEVSKLIMGWFEYADTPGNERKRLAAELMAT